MEQEERPRRLTHLQDPFPLSRKLEGKSRTDFELVVARYDEDISWTDHYIPFRTVYNKGATDVSYAFIPLKNEGHLADTILRHILDRYDTLAVTTFFCHGAINYRADQPISSDTWERFMGCSPNFLEFLEDTDLPNKRKIFGDCKETISEMHLRFFRTPYYPLFKWARGLWISVGRNRIRKRPREFYKRMLDWIHAPDPTGAVAPSQKLYRDRGIYIERFLLKAFL
jgi:hypothetical protein